MAGNRGKTSPFVQNRTNTTGDDDLFKKPTRPREATVEKEALHVQCLWNLRKTGPGPIMARGPVVGESNKGGQKNRQTKPRTGDGGLGYNYDGSNYGEGGEYKDTKINTKKTYVWWGGASRTGPRAGHPPRRRPPQ